MKSPDPRFQIEFLQQLQSLLADGGFSATYKFALLHAIADLCVERDPSPDGSLTLRTEELAAKFIELYWRQAKTFPVGHSSDVTVLRQNTGQQASVINTLCELQAEYDPRLTAVRNDPATWAAAVQGVSSTIKKMPLWKLQTIGSRSVEFMYRNNPGASHIELLPGIAGCFRSFHGLVVELVRSGWVRFIRRHNDSVRENLELYTFLFGSERVSLEAYREILADVDGNRCFYCNKSITKEIQVDHFVPWARYPNNLGHNLVLAHRSCNASKSDHLAAEEHLAHWIDRNRSVGQILSTGFQSSGLAHDCEASIRIACWAYDQMEATSGEVWVQGREFSPLGSTWRQVIGACG